MIPHSKPTLDERDFVSVSEVFKSGQIAQGEKVAEFEKRMAHFVGTKNGVATNSGTSALHLALAALGVKEGDEVIVPSYVCTAPLNAINYLRATPVLVDINPHSFNLDVRKLTNCVTKKTKVIIVPHLFGLPADMDEILSIGIPVIEDVAQALGATYRGRNIGSWGVLSVLSFYATKVITTGEGGMVLSESEELLEKIRDLRDYDKKQDYKIRYNYKMTNFQAALGISQLERLPFFLKRRKDIALKYSRWLRELPIVLPIQPIDRNHIFYRYVVQIEGDLNKYMRLLYERGISCERPVYRPLHHYLGLDNLPQTDKVWNTALSIPLYPSLKEEEVERIIETVRDVTLNLKR